MFAQKFFKVFPPPKFLDTPYAGITISDDAVRCIEYSRGKKGLKIHKYGFKALEPGVIDGGEIKDEKALTDALTALSKELKVFVAKVAISEEKMYLFKTAVPSTDIKEMRQNIEFKLEENVPLTADEALFFFDPIPRETGVVIQNATDANPVGVSVAPRSMIENYLDVVKKAGIAVLSFEVCAKSLARAVVPLNSTTTDLLVHIMNKKTGLYIVCGGVVCFTSTILWGQSHIKDEDVKARYAELKKSILQVKNYWHDHGLGTSINSVIFAGKGALSDGLVSECSSGFATAEETVRFEIANIWKNAFSSDDYIPPISYEDSLEYGVAAGVGLYYTQ